MACNYWMGFKNVYFNDWLIVDIPGVVFSLLVAKCYR